VRFSWNLEYGVLMVEGLSIVKIIQAAWSLHINENRIIVRPVNILTGVVRQLLGPRNTLPCVLITPFCADNLTLCAILYNSQCHVIVATPKTLNAINCVTCYICACVYSNMLHLQRQNWLLPPTIQIPLRVAHRPLPKPLVYWTDND